MEAIATATTEQPTGLVAALAAEIGKLPPLRRGPEIRKRIAVVQAQVCELDANLQAAAAAAAAEDARHSRAAIDALSAGKPVPPRPPDGKSPVPEIRRQLQALQPILSALAKLDRDGQNEELTAFKQHMYVFMQSQKEQAEKRHHHVIDGLLDLLAPYRLPAAYLVEAVNDLVHTIHQCPSPEETSYREKLLELAKDHPLPARQLRMEAGVARVGRTGMTDDFIKAKIKAHLESREAGKR